MSSRELKLLMFECQQNNDWLNKMRLQQAYRGFVTFPLTSSLWLERSISYAGLKRNQIHDIGSDPARAPTSSSFLFSSCSLASCSNLAKNK